VINTMVSDAKVKKTSVLFVKNLKIIKNRDFFMAYFRVWVLMFFIAFRLDSILNKQKIKKIVFLVKMAEMVSFRLNHKIFSAFVARSGKKSKQKF
jgi:hypothetical protein